jgi:pyruvate formate lyase activating enzyme
MEAIVRNIIPFSSVDGPGNRTAIFLQGCNFNCWYCHNPETIQILNASNIETVEGVKVMTVEDLCATVRPYYDFTSGITFSGGECSVQGEFLAACCKQLKKEGRHILIDTNGYINQETLDRLLPVVDGFMFDIKAFDDEEHLKLTGKHNKLIWDNMIQVAQAGKLYEIRTVIVPEVLNNELTVQNVAEFIVNSSPATRYKIIKYRTHGVREMYAQQMHSPDSAYVAKLFKLAKEKGVQELIML